MQLLCTKPSGSEMCPLLLTEYLESRRLVRIYKIVTNYREILSIYTYTAQRICLLHYLINLPLELSGVVILAISVLCKMNGF